MKKNNLPVTKKEYNMDINPCGCGGIGNHSIREGHAIYCFNCRLTTQKYTTKGDAIEVWNKAMPKLSNSQQAIEWLESGKKITTDDDYLLEYVFQEEHKRIYVKYKENERTEPFSIFWEYLFLLEWKLYEENEYTLSFEEAVQAFIHGERATTEIDGEEYYIDCINITHIVLHGVKSNDEVLLKKGDKKYHDLVIKKWRVWKYIEAENEA